MISLRVEKAVGIHSGGTKYYRVYRVTVVVPTVFAPPREQFFTVRNWGAARAGSEHLEERNHGQSSIDLGDTFGASVANKEKRRKTGHYDFTVSETGPSTGHTTERALRAELERRFKPSTVDQIVGKLVGLEKATELAREALDEHLQEEAKLAAAAAHQQRVIETNPMWGSW